MNNYTIHYGKWICHTCKAEVKSLRLYAEDMLLTWMCPQKHLSQVSLAKRKKKDYDGEK